jgi:hypothetical protein
MRDRSPYAFDFAVDALESAQPVEVGCRGALGGYERAPLLGEQLAHGGLDVLRLDGGELR